MVILEAKHISFTVASRPILQDISLELNGGDRLILLGASGSGKSTLLQLLNRLQSPTTGSLIFAGKTYNSYAPEILRQRISLVPQETKLLGMTVLEAIFYPLRLQKIPLSDIKNRWLQLQEVIDIPEVWLDRTEALLSGGQKQWVAIARSLMLQPEILLLDEPTAALDLGRTQTLVEVLLRYQQRTNIPIVMATHEWEFAQQMATYIIYLEQGEIQHQGHHQDFDWAMVRQKLLAHRQSFDSDTW